MYPKIPDKLFFKIGEVAETAGVEKHVLRFWEQEFDILKPEKNRAGQRLYQKKDVELVLMIKNLLYQEKYTLAGARKKLMERNKPVQKNLNFDPQQLANLKKKMEKDLGAILKMLGK